MDNNREINTLFIESERVFKSNDSSRRPSNESTCSLNVPLQRFERIDTPQVTNTTLSIDMIRSQSLHNISKFTKSSSIPFGVEQLNGIEESPRDKTPYRRGSLPFDKPKLSNYGNVKDAFGPRLGDDSQLTLPGTPLPSLVQDSFEDIPDIPDTPVVVDKNYGLDPESLYFRDGRRKIDMILVYEEEEFGVMTEAEAKRRDRRKVFQENLIREGLELELEHKDISFDGKTWFLKVHLPWKTKTRYAAVMGLKLPVKRFITISVKAWDDNKSEGKNENLYSKWQRRWKKFFEYNHDLIPEEPSFYDATEGGDREEHWE